MLSEYAHPRAHGRRRRWTIGVIAVATLLVLPAHAHAQAPHPGGGAAVDEYVEEVPASGGKVFPGSGAGKQAPSGGGTQGAQARKTLPAPAASRLESEGGEDSAALRTIATSPDYGAPTRARPGELKATEKPRPTPDDDTSVTEALGAAGSAVMGDGSTRLVGLLVALALISGAVLVGAARRHARGRRL